MRFFHLSDLHIGLRLHNRDLYEDQRVIFGQISALAREYRPDAVVIAGDIYDKSVPSQDAVALFDEFLTGLSEAAPDAEIMMISGNHDSGIRINTFRSILQKQHIHMIGLPPQKEGEHIEKVVLRDEFGPVNFYLLPFVRPSMLRALLPEREDGAARSYDESVRALLAREEIDPSERNVLVSHQFYLPDGARAEDVERMASEIVIVGNIDQVSASCLEPFDYAALGHIHKPMKVGSERFRYSGTPLACSLSEAGQKKGVILVELPEKGTLKTEVLPLYPKRAVREIRGLLLELCAQPSEDYVRVVLTDKEDLDVFEMQDRLRAAFPNLLEIRRDTAMAETRDFSYDPEEQRTPMELITAFLGDVDEEEEALLRAVLQKVQEESV